MPLAENLEAQPLMLSGRYRCLERLGAGATATVWLARDELLRREVAIKILEDDDDPLEAERRRSRFLREARVIGGLRHPNVVAVLDARAEADEPAYLVMEQIEGAETLADVLERGLQGLEIASVMDGLLAGLEEVHRHGVIHRDIKPENLLIESQDDGSLRPQLIDFGISRSMLPVPGESVTQEGLVRGSPYYMPPEQARGLAIDARADLYAAGVVLYELLSGALPFEGETVIDVLLAVTVGSPIPLEEMRPGLAPPIYDVVRRAMARQPEGRFADAAEMRAAVADALFVGTPTVSGLYPVAQAKGAESEEKLATLDAPTEELTAPEAPPLSPNAARERPSRSMIRHAVGGAGVALSAMLALGAWVVATHAPLLSKAEATASAKPAAETEPAPTPRASLASVHAAETAPQAAPPPPPAVEPVQPPPMRPTTAPTRRRTRLAAPPARLFRDPGF